MTNDDRSRALIRRSFPGIATEGLPFIGAGLALTGLVASLNRRLALLPLALTGLTTYFFRDPTRDVPADPRYLYAAADGRVILVDEIEEPRFIKGPAYRIATFLSIFDVHINRSPCRGIVRYREHISGAFKAAWDKTVPEVNERNYLGIESPYGPILVVQIAGLVARRIVCWAEVDEEIASGERFGLIRFGSRTDLIFPRSMGRPLVAPGARVYGGVTPLGECYEG
ncbi:MAG: phosphatidylserine decarboxylase proenzyme [Herpetosiphonaceae bacterium]|nr:MAG: phosphatidylserine decarboxylase proenzyme [Herpetosiphonaceae bacterium]